jgi:hypothetical protein
LAACNDQSPNTEPVITGNVQNKDSAIAGSDSLLLRRTTELTETTLRHRSPPVVETRPIPRVPGKRVAKPKAKLGSIAIREADNLPLYKGN